MFKEASFIIAQAWQQGRFFSSGCKDKQTAEQPIMKYYSIRRRNDGY